MGREMFELGLFNPEVRERGPIMIPRTWDADTVVRSVPWLRGENRDGRNIFCRPKGEHNLSLIDDLSAAAVTEMKRSGFGPCTGCRNLAEKFPGVGQAFQAAAA